MTLEGTEKGARMELTTCMNCGKREDPFVVMNERLFCRRCARIYKEALDIVKSYEDGGDLNGEKTE